MAAVTGGFSGVLADGPLDPLDPFDLLDPLDPLDPLDEEEADVDRGYAGPERSAACGREREAGELAGRGGGAGFTAASLATGAGTGAGARLFSVSVTAPEPGGRFTSCAETD
jgi:hypothetical protein